MSGLHVVKKLGRAGVGHEWVRWVEFGPGERVMNHLYAPSGVPVTLVPFF